MTTSTEAKSDSNETKIEGDATSPDADLKAQIEKLNEAFKVEKESLVGRFDDVQV